ncbi:MAG TPA: WYL domain-containing protein [Chthonomonadaceae bacterium]|nr:WYL domain-containing protein [Chthonomonadaceae bacterium]
MNIKHPDRLYKSDRLNYIVNRMRVRQDITPSKLAEELHVSERTIYRDLRFLEKGQALRKRYSRREGRYLLETELNLPPITLTPSEALALTTAGSNPALAHHNFYAGDLRSGLRKIETALAPTPPKSGEERTDGAAVSTRDSIHRPTLEMIRRAMRSNRKIRIRYMPPANDREQTLTIAPYDVRQQNGSWYLLANSPDHGMIRTFKINRVRAVEILNDRFRFPRRFSADDCFAKAWEATGKSDDEVTVRVRFKPSVADVVTENCQRQFDKMEKQPDGSLICTTTVNNASEIAWWVLSYGSAAEVLGPPELRSDFARTAREMADMYS